MTTNDDEERGLRERARARMRRGQLPTKRPDGTWGGPGSGERCALCESQIGFGDVEFEVEFGDGVGPAQTLERLYFHGRCFATYELERERLGAASRPSYEAERHLSAASSAGAGNAEST